MKFFVTGGSDSESAEAKPVARFHPLPVGVELILLSCLIFIVESILRMKTGILYFQKHAK